MTVLHGLGGLGMSAHGRQAMGEQMQENVVQVDSRGSRVEVLIPHTQVISVHAHIYDIYDRCK